MISPGEIYLAHTDGGIRPVVVVSREELNRGNWVVAALITSTRFSLRSTLPQSLGQALTPGKDRSSEIPTGTLTPA